jgi:hypothetical protein
MILPGGLMAREWAGVVSDQRRGARALFDEALARPALVSADFLLVWSPRVSLKGNGSGARPAVHPFVADQ